MFDRLRRLPPTLQLQGTMPGFSNGRPGRPAPDLGTQLRPGGVGGPVTVSQDNYLSTRQASWRLPEQSAWKDPAGAPGIGCVHKHDVEASMQPSVLEAVIQHQYFAFQFFDRNPGQLDPIFS